MSCEPRKTGKKLLFCFDLDAETILLFISFLIMYMATVHFCNWLIFYCLYFSTPYIVLIVAYFAGGFFLFFGVVCGSRFLVQIFPWIMSFCLITNAIFVVMVYVDQECVLKNVRWATETNHVLLANLEFFIINFVAGIHYVITLYVTLLVSDFLSENCE